MCPRPCIDILVRGGEHAGNSRKLDNNMGSGARVTQCEDPSFSSSLTGFKTAKETHYGCVCEKPVTFKGHRYQPILTLDSRLKNGKVGFCSVKSHTQPAWLQRGHSRSGQPPSP